MNKSPWGPDQLRHSQDLHQFQQFKIRTFQFKGRLYDILKFSAPYWNSSSQDANACLLLFFYTTAFL